MLLFGEKRVLGEIMLVSTSYALYLTSNFFLTSNLLSIFNMNYVFNCSRGEPLPASLHGDISGDPSSASNREWIPPVIQTITAQTPAQTLDTPAVGFGTMVLFQLLQVPQSGRAAVGLVLIQALYTEACLWYTVIYLRHPRGYLRHPEVCRGILSNSIDHTPQSVQPIRFGLG